MVNQHRETLWHNLIGQVVNVHTSEHLKKYEWTHIELQYYNQSKFIYVYYIYLLYNLY